MSGMSAQTPDGEMPLADALSAQVPQEGLQRLLASDVLSVLCGKLVQQLDSPTIA